jgi:hypothetical protein
MGLVTMADRKDTPPRSRAESEGDFGQAKRRGGGGKLARSETVTVRLDPKLRYLAELAARKQRRTLSSFIEWAIEEILKSVYFSENRGDFDKSVASEAAELWDVDAPDRFVKLAMRYPHMLTHDEQVLWKLLRENGALWKGHFDNSTHQWTWTLEESSMNFERLRTHWEKFVAVARGEADGSALPTWQKVQASMDDEILF